MKKGFTLVELLAVIVILAIIALIAVPIILNIIGDAKKESDERSKELYINAIEQAIARKNLTEEFNPKTCTVKTDGNLKCDTGDLIVEVEGTKPTGGSITMENGVVTSENLVFDGSTPKPLETQFEKDSWDTIVENVQSGNTSQYNVGDTKTINLNGLGDQVVRIANNSTPTECSSEGFSETACGFVLEFENVITTHFMNSTATNAGGWESSDLREYLNSDILALLPEALQNSIIGTKVVSGHEKDKSDNYVTTDKLYLLSSKEIWGTDLTGKDTADDKTRQLDYYNRQGIEYAPGKYDPLMKKYQGNFKEWWLRSADESSNTNFDHIINPQSGWGTASASNENGVSPAFRLK